MPLFYFIIFCLMIIIAWAIRIIKESERIVIFRLGRFFDIRGPGVVVIIPIVDKTIKINLNEKIPNWQQMQENDLINKVKEIAISEM
jgi:regulator of protease activity HflC (stomatin/prohibitin superfamily)